MLDSLLRQSGAEEIEFAFTATGTQPGRCRNFWNRSARGRAAVCKASRFRDVCGPLPHQMNEVLS